MSGLLCVSFGASSLALSALGWLAWINLALAAFNLLPAAPLDGGRVLHGLVWLAGRNRWRATRVAAGAGIFLGLMFVLGGCRSPTKSANDLFDGLLIGFIGWWMFASARGELGVGAVHLVFDGVTVAEVMRPVGEAPGWITIRAFIEQYAAAKPGWVWLPRDWEWAFLRRGGRRRRAHPVPLPPVGPDPPPRRGHPVDRHDRLRARRFGGVGPARTVGRQIVFVIGDGATLGAIVPSDLEARIRVGGRPSPWPPPRAGGQ